MLTEEQIASLYQFCVKHYVRYYDLQVELVDHLAASIEKEMEQLPALRFEEALNKVYKGFGIMGFSRIITEREISLRKRYQKNFWLSFLSYLTIPRIALTCLIFGVLNTPFFLGQGQHAGRWFIIYCIAGAVMGLVTLIYTVKKYKKPKKQLLLLQSSGGAFGLFAMMLQLPNFYYNIFLGGDKASAARQFSTAEMMLVTGVFTTIVIMFIAYFETYKSLHRKARHDYPKAFE